MTTQTASRTPQTFAASSRTRKPSPPLHRADVCERHRQIRLGFRVPRRQACLTKRAMVAALREAEFKEWLHDGYDHMSSMHQPVD